MANKIFQCIGSLNYPNNPGPVEALKPPITHPSNNYVKLIETMRCYSSCKDSNSSGKYGDNLAAVLHGIKDLKMEKKPVPKFNDDQVLLQMECVGICGSDVKYFLDGKIGHFVVKSPMIIGHEASGTVLECGKNVDNVKPGDKVAIEPQRNCRKCIYCKTGSYHLCPKIFFCATPPDDGNLCRYFAHDADFCHKLPCDMDYEHGCLMEPLAVGVHSCKRAKVTNGDSVLVLGSGPIGLVSLLAAKAYGASKIVVTDIDDFKLKKAMELGADCAINVKGLCENDIVKEVSQIIGDKPDKTIDCCGFEEALRVGLLATKSGGKFVLAGCGPNDVKLPLSQVILREVDILGVFRYVNDYPTAIEMVQSGKFDPKPLITHHFKLEDAVKAFETAANKKEPYIKIMIHTNPEWKGNNKC